MKKTYMQPATLLTKVAVHRMICQSNNPNVKINKSGSVDAGDVGSRGSSSFWDDDDE